MALDGPALSSQLHLNFSVGILCFIAVVHSTQLVYKPVDEACIHCRLAGQNEAGDEYITWLCLSRTTDVIEKHHLTDGYVYRKPLGGEEL